jgi:hypothetical protein
MSETPAEYNVFGMAGEAAARHIDDLILGRVVDPPRTPVHEPFALTVLFEWNWNCGGLGVTWILSHRSHIYSVALNLLFLTVSVEYA